ncbi:MAG TPA: CHASE3 domain-containing protein [Methylophilus sp.]
MQNFLKKLLKKSDLLYAIFGAKTITFLVLALLIAMMTIFFSDSWILKIKSKDVEIGNLRKIIVGLNQIKGNMYQAESAQRGYLITFEKQYVAPYDQALTNARVNIKKVDEVMHAFRTEQEYRTEAEILNTISANMESKASEMNLTIKLAQKGSRTNARQVLDMDGGLHDMRKIVANTDKLLDIYYKELTNVVDERRSSTTLARASVIGGPMVLILLVVLVIQQLLKELSEKHVLQQTLQNINAQNEAKLKEQSRLLACLALDNQADVERERQKLGRELHDELGSILTATKMDLAWVMKTLKDTRPDIVDKLKKTNGYLDQGISFKRQIVQELHPSMISSFGFWPALKTMINDVVERNNWELTLTLPEESTVINETISIIAYRVLQETLNNATKYAKATEMAIHIIADDHFLKIEIQDNGKGMEVDKLEKNTHGLSGMRHRVLAIGGIFELKSSANGGVFTRVMLPLNTRADD